jgi:uncharacterized protein YajQ (UPF0234 family)
MPSFDVVSEVDLHVFTNAIDQAARLITNRFDFKGVDAGFDRKERVVTLHAESEFQLQQMRDVLRTSIAKCGIDARAMKEADPQGGGRIVKQEITMRHGIEIELARQIVKIIKEGKLKVQASIQGDQVRVNGKKRDDLQEAIALLRKQELEAPLQFQNFRD